MIGLLLFVAIIAFFAGNPDLGTGMLLVALVLYMMGNDRRRWRY